MRALLHASLAGALLVSCTGCLVARAKTVEPLNMPEPPTRVVAPPSVPVEVPPVVTAAPPPTPPATKPDEVPPPGGPPRTVPPPATPPPATPPPDTGGVLQTQPNTQELENKARVQLDNARRDLGKVDRRTLPRHAQDQYDLAQQMCTKADEYLKAKNFNLAWSQADKAATLAAQLVKGRKTSPTSL